MDKCNTLPPSVKTTEHGVFGSPGLSADAVELGCGELDAAAELVVDDAEVPHPASPMTRANAVSRQKRMMGIFPLAAPGLLAHHERRGGAAAQAIIRFMERPSQSNSWESTARGSLWSTLIG